MSLWVIGTGQMSLDYVKVLKNLEVDFEIIGRGAVSANKFFKTSGIRPIQGEIKNALKHLKHPDVAIIATSIDQLAKVSINLIDIGVKKILIEEDLLPD